MVLKTSLISISLDHFNTHSLTRKCTRVGPRRGYKIGRQPLAKNDSHNILFILHCSVTPAPPSESGLNICFGENPMSLLSPSEKNLRKYISCRRRFPPTYYINTVLCLIKKTKDNNINTMASCVVRTVYVCRTYPIYGFDSTNDTALQNS